METIYASRLCENGLAAALNARTYGNGTQTVVLSHGFGADQSIWHNMIPLLALFFKVLVYDLAFSPNVQVNHQPLYDPERYTNFSAYAQDLTSILDELNIKDSIFVGHSMSAMIGCIAAAQRPDLFRQLVLLNGSPRYLNDKETGYKGGFSQAQVDAIFVSINTNYSGWVHGFAPLAIGVDNKSAIDEFERSLLKLSAPVVLTTAEVVFQSDNREVLSQVNVRTTIVQSDYDAIVPNSVARYMKKKLGHLAKPRLIILKNTTGHFLQLTEPDLLARVLRGVMVS